MRASAPHDPSGPLLAVTLGFLLTAGVSAQTLPVEVQRVYDGDTIPAAVAILPLCVVSALTVYWL